MIELRGLSQPFSGVHKHIDPGQALLVVFNPVKVIQQVQVVAPLFAPGRQQRVGGRVQGGAVHRRRTGRLDALAAPHLGAQLVMAFNDVAPKILTGVLHQHQHLADLAQLRQCLHGLHGQGGDAEHHQARRQP